MCGCVSSTSKKWNGSDEEALATSTKTVSLRILTPNECDEDIVGSITNHVDDEILPDDSPPHSEIFFDAFTNTYSHTTIRRSMASVAPSNSSANIRSASASNASLSLTLPVGTGILSAKTYHGPSMRGDFKCTAELAALYDDSEEHSFYNKQYNMTMEEYENLGIYSKYRLTQMALDIRRVRSSIVIIEPYKHVGHNQEGNEVRCGINIAQFMKHCFGTSTILLPMWRTGILDNKTASYISQSQMIIVEGGDSSTYIPETWPEALKPHDCFDFIASLLLERSFTRAQMFICLGHQLVATAHIWLIRKICKDVSTHSKDPELTKFARKIHKAGESVKIVKGGKIICTGYTHAKFAVAPNEVKEVQVVQLDPYVPPERSDLKRFTKAHFTCSRSAGHQILGQDVSMFHGDEVNEEAILFANWVYVELANLLNKKLKVRLGVAKSQKLRYLLNAPIGIEIVGSTKIGKYKTEVAATQIYYRSNFPTQAEEYLVSYSMQFHPELWDDVGVFADVGNKEMTAKEYRQKTHFNIMTRMFTSQTAAKEENGETPSFYRRISTFRHPLSMVDTASTSTSTGGALIPSFTEMPKTPAQGIVAQLINQRSSSKIVG